MFSANIFCSFFSFCTFIIALIYDLSRGKSKFFKKNRVKYFLTRLTPAAARNLNKFAQNGAKSVCNGKNRCYNNVARTHCTAARKANKG